MHSNLTNQQPLSEKKNISWVLGIISLLLIGFYGPIGWVIWRLSVPLTEQKFVSTEFIYDFMSIFGIFYQIGIFTIAIFGLIQGKKEEKSSRKKSGFIGIVLCSISLMLLLLMDFILLFASI